MRPSLLALSLTALVLSGCGVGNAVQRARAGGGAQGGPSVTWSGQVQPYEDSAFQTPSENLPIPIRIEVYQGGARNGADGVARIGGGEDCPYRLTRAGTQTEDGVTIVLFDAVYAGGEDLSSIAGRAMATLWCGQSATHGRLITAPLDDGLEVGFVGETGPGSFVNYRGTLPPPAN